MNLVISPFLIGSLILQLFDRHFCPKRITVHSKLGTFETLLIRYQLSYRKVIIESQHHKSNIGNKIK